MKTNLNKAAVLGAGSWGTALAIVLSEHFKDIVLIGRSPEQADEINTQHTNSKYLPKVSIPHNIRCSTDLSEAKTAEIILFTIPTSATREASRQLSEIGIPSTIPLISCAKGIERGTGTRMSNIIFETLPNNPIAVISGPNHAEEVAENLATCTVVGSIDKKLTSNLQKVFSTANRLR